MGSCQNQLPVYSELSPASGGTEPGALECLDLKTDLLDLNNYMDSARRLSRGFCRFEAAPAPRIDRKPKLGPAPRRCCEAVVCPLVRGCEIARRTERSCGNLAPAREPIL